MAHIPVLLEETMRALEPKPNEDFVDGTFGRGGHAAALLERIAPKGKVIGLDWDKESLDSYSAESGDKYGSRLILKNSNFTKLTQAIPPEMIGKISGVLFDLGISSWHVDESAKGFSYSKDEALDMRFDRTGELTARDIVNDWPVRDLERVIGEYGEEKQARKIALAVEKARTSRKIETTGHLAAIIAKTARGQRTAALARIFQALRIKVNGELDNIVPGLEQGLQVLKPAGRMAVISFHSLEDRIVKIKFREWVAQGVAEYINEKPIVPSAGEIAANPRARSAKLRSIKKTTTSI